MATAVDAYLFPLAGGDGADDSDLRGWWVVSPILQAQAISVGRNISHVISLSSAESVSNALGRYYTVPTITSSEVVSLIKNVRKIFTIIPVAHLTAPSTTTTPIIAASVSTTATTGGGNVNNLLTGWYANNWFWNNGQSGVSITWDMGSGIQRCVTDARWVQGTSDTHGTWQWQGSNDNSSYTNIGSTFTLGGAATTDFSTQLSGNATAYRYYRIAQQSGTTSSGPWLFFMSFEGITGATRDATGYCSQYGMGNRTSIITTTTNATTLGGSGPVTNLVNGQTGIDNYGYSWSGGQSNIYLRFDFGAGVVVLITEITFIETPTNSHGTWQTQGSNDALNWTNIGSTFTLGGSSATTISLSSNTAAYRYYQLQQQSGTTNQTPFMEQFLFQITNGTTPASPTVTLLRSIGRIASIAQTSSIVLSKFIAHKISTMTSAETVTLAATRTVQKIIAMINPPP